MVKKTKYYFFIISLVVYFIASAFVLMKVALFGGITESFLSYEVINNRETLLISDTLTVHNTHETDPSSTFYGTITFEGILSKTKTNATLSIEKVQKYRYIYSPKDSINKLEVYTNNLTDELFLKDVENEKAYFQKQMNRIYFEFLLYLFSLLGTLYVIFIILKTFIYGSKKQN